MNVFCRHQFSRRLCLPTSRFHWTIFRARTSGKKKVERDFHPRGQVFNHHQIVAFFFVLRGCRLKCTRGMEIQKKSLARDGTRKCKTHFTVQIKRLIVYFNWIVEQSVCEFVSECKEFLDQTSWNLINRRFSKETLFRQDSVRNIWNRYLQSIFNNLQSTFNNQNLRNNQQSISNQQSTINYQ